MEEILIVLACLAVNALLAACEMAFVSAPKPELRRLARTGVLEAQRVLDLRAHPERTLSVIQIGITLVGALAAAVGGAGAVESVEPYLVQRFGLSSVIAEGVAVVVIVIPLTLMSVLVGELIPKTLALKDPVHIALLSARWLSWGDRLMSPLVNLLGWITKLATQVLPRKRKSAAPPPTTVEIDDLSPAHQQYVLNLASIDRKKVQDVLLPRARVNLVGVDDSLEQVAQVVFTSGHTRLPVLRDDCVVGILHTKEFLAYRETGKRNWQSIVRPFIRAQLGDSLLGALRVMQQRRSHMAIAVSSEHEFVGIVTMEDIIEEIVGQLQDEDDDGKLSRVYLAQLPPVLTSRHPVGPDRNDKILRMWRKASSLHRG